MICISRLRARISGADCWKTGQQAKIKEVFSQIESQVPEMQRAFAYPAIATQFRTQAASAPEEERDAMLYAAQELERRAAKAMPAGADPIEGG